MLLWLLQIQTRLSTTRLLQNFWATNVQHTSIDYRFHLKQSDDTSFDTDEGDVILKGKWFPENLVHKFNNAPGEDFSKFSVSIFCGV